MSMAQPSSQGRLQSVIRSGGQSSEMPDQMKVSATALHKLHAWSLPCPQVCTVVTWGILCYYIWVHHLQLLWQGECTSRLLLLPSQEPPATLHTQSSPHCNGIRTGRNGRNCQHSDCCCATRSGIPRALDPPNPGTCKFRWHGGFSRCAPSCPSATGQHEAVYI